MKILIGGMNRYRRWIDARDYHVLLASLLLSALIFTTLWLTTWGIIFAWWWATLAVPLLLVVSVYLGVAQATSWRWPGE